MIATMPGYRPINKAKKIDIAFLFQAGTVWPSWESVYRVCINDERFNVRLILITDITVEASHNIGAETFLVENGISYEKAEDIDLNEYIPHIAVVQFPYDAAFHTPEMLSLQLKNRGSRVVYIPYGIEISDTMVAKKDHFYSRVVENAWRIYTSSEGINEEYQKYCRNRNAVRVTGSPKFDSIHDRKKFALNSEYVSEVSGRKIVVWKIHFPKKNNADGRTVMITPDIREYLKFAEIMDYYEDLFFILMPHPKILGKMTESDCQGDESMIRDMRLLLDTVDAKDNAVIDTSRDYRNSLYNADAIVMDRSAVMVEAAMLDVPVLIMQNSDYEEPMIKPVQEVVDSCMKGSTCDDIAGFLDAFCSDDRSKLKDRKRVIDRWFPFLDGKCGERIARDMFESIYGEDVERLPRVVLYGTGEVASYYMKEQGWSNPKGFEIVLICDSNESKQGTDYYGYGVCSPSAIRETEFDYIVVMTEPHFYEIQKSLVYDLYIDDRKVLRLDEFITYILGN